MDHRYQGPVCPICHDPTCAGCEKVEETDCICLEHIGDNGKCPVHGKLYQSSAASVFASAARGEKVS